MMIGRCISCWSNPFLGDMLICGSVVTAPPSICTLRWLLLELLRVFSMVCFWSFTMGLYQKVHWGHTTFWEGRTSSPNKWWWIKYLVHPGTRYNTFCPFEKQAKHRHWLEIGNFMDLLCHQPSIMCEKIDDGWAEICKSMFSRKKHDHFLDL